MSIQARVEAHHRLTYQQNVQMVAQQMQNRLRPAVTIVPAKGEAHSVADLLGDKEYIRGEDRSRRNPENVTARSRRWLVRPPVIEDGEYIDTVDKFDMALDPTSYLMRNSIAAVERGVFDVILGIARAEDGSFAVSGSGILGKATSGKRPTTASDLPAANFIAADLDGDSTAEGLTLDKLRAVKLALNKAEFGMEDDDELYAAITPEQVDDLIGIAAATNQSLNAFAVDQLRSGKPTMLMGINWIATNRLPKDSNGNRLCPVWSKRNVVVGMWQDVRGDMWNDTSAKNLPYIYTSAYVDAVRVEDGGVRVIRCAES
ncbi:MAG: phage capsid protein [Rhodosalinus sp.]